MPKEKFKLSKGELSKAWKQSFENKDEYKGGGFEPEDGRYVVAVTDASRGESKASGRDQVSWEYTFLDGDYKGRTTRSFDGLDRTESVPHVMRRIIALGFEVPEDLDGLEDVLKKIAKKKPKVRILIKTKGDYRNIYIDKLVDDDGEELAEGEEKSDEEEEAPIKKKVSKEAPAKEEEEEETEEGEATIEVGMQVRCLDEDDEEVGVGKIHEIDEDSGEVIVTMEETGKKKIFPVAQLRLLPKEKEAPKKKGMKIGK